MADRVAECSQVAWVAVILVLASERTDRRETVFNEEDAVVFQDRSRGIIQIGQFRVVAAQRPGLSRHRIAPVRDRLQQNKEFCPPRCPR